MKRDMELVRALLLDIEAMPSGRIYQTDTSSITGFTKDDLEQHFQLLDQAGFIENAQFLLSGNGVCHGLTWEGHEFLDSIRSDSVWSKVKAQLRDTGVSATVEVVKGLALAIARQQLGL